MAATTMTTRILATVWCCNVPLYLRRPGDRMTCSRCGVAHVLRALEVAATWPTKELDDDEEEGWYANRD